MLHGVLGAKVGTLAVPVSFRGQQFTQPVVICGSLSSLDQTGPTCLWGHCLTVD